MEKEKRYLKVWQKIAYGSDGMGHCFFYTFVSTYIMVYMGSVGLNAGIVGTLMLASKCLDGLSDIFFGSVIDKTHSKWGKARPWVIGGAIPLAIVEFLMFAIPDMGRTAQYAYFFVIYCAANAVFYTINNCAYNTLSNLITHNKTEKVQLGAISLVGESIAGIIIPYACTRLVNAFGGGTEGWKAAAFVFCLAQLLFASITFFGSKEIPPEEDITEVKIEKEEKVSFFRILKIVATNKYYLIMLGISVMIACIGTTFFTSGAYYAEWILGDGALLSAISTAFSAGMLVGMFSNPILVSKIGYRKTMGYTNLVSIFFMILFAIGAYTRNMPLLLIGMFFKNMTGFSAIGCCLYAAIGDIAKYSYRLHGLHVEGSMFSCSSMGRKVGQGITASACGWLLTLGGFVGTAAVQSAGAMNMILFMFGILPLIFTVILTILCFCLKVEEANERWEKAHIKNEI